MNDCPFCDLHGLIEEYQNLPGRYSAALSQVESLKAQLAAERQKLLAEQAAVVVWREQAWKSSESFGVADKALSDILLVEYREDIALDLWLQIHEIAKNARTSISSTHSTAFLAERERLLEVWRLGEKAYSNGWQTTEDWIAFRNAWLKAREALKDTQP